MSRGTPVRGWLRRTWLAAGLTVPVALTAALTTLPAESVESAESAGADRTATVNVVHGIPGVTVKVCVDGRPAIRGFRYGEKVVGVALPAGTHRVRVVPAGKACSTAAVLRKRYELAAGTSYTIVAARGPKGAPRLPAFVNRVRPTKPGMARLTVRHTAQAPAVNVWAGPTRLVGGTGFTWGESRTVAVPRGTYRVKVTLPGARRPVIGPDHLRLRAGKAYQVHAVGTSGRYRLVVVRVDVGTR